MNKFLAIDTSTDICAVALEVGDQTFTEVLDTPQQHANHLLAMIERLLSQANIQGTELDALILGEGPGAFTGVRIAAGVVQGLALGWNVPVIEVSSLSSMGIHFFEQLPVSDADVTVACALDARMKEIYLQFITKSSNGDIRFADTELLGLEVVQARLNQMNSQADALFLVGDVAEVYPDVIADLSAEQVIEMKPCAQSMIKLAKIQGFTARSLQESIPQPVYLRNNIAETIEERMKKIKK